MSGLWNEGGLFRYFVIRLALSVLVLIGSITLLCSLTLIVPGDPATILLGPRATPQTVQTFSEQMGLTLPLYERVALFFANVLRGDLGVDVISGRSVAEMVLRALPNTVLLAVSAIGLAVLVGVPIGSYAAVRQGSLLDQTLAVVECRPGGDAKLCDRHHAALSLLGPPRLVSGARLRRSRQSCSISSTISSCRRSRSPSAGSAISPGWCARRCLRCSASPISGPPAPMGSRSGGSS